MRMYCATRLIVTSLLLGAIPANCQSPSKPSGVPFLHGLKVRVNGKTTLPFGLNTGAAPGSSITPNCAQKLGLPIVGPRVLHTSDKQTSSATDQADLVRAYTLEIDGHRFNAITGVASPEAHYDGTIGIAFFRKVLLTLDYPNDRLSVSEGALPAPDEKEVISYTTHPDAAFTPLRVSPTVALQLAGRPYSALLDTGARKIPADLIVPASIAGELPLGPTIMETTISGASGQSFPSHTARLKGDLTIGSLVFHHPTVMVSDWLGFLDLAGMVNCMRITIDQQNRRLQIAAPHTLGCSRQ